MQINWCCWHQVATQLDWSTNRLASRPCLVLTLWSQDTRVTRHFGTNTNYLKYIGYCTAIMSWQCNCLYCIIYYKTDGTLQSQFMDYSYLGTFVPWTIRTTGDYSYHGRFVWWMFRTTDVSYYALFVPFVNCSHNINCWSTSADEVLWSQRHLGCLQLQNNWW